MFKSKIALILAVIYLLIPSFVLIVDYYSYDTDLQGFMNFGPYFWTRLLAFPLWGGYTLITGNYVSTYGYGSDHVVIPSLVYHLGVSIIIYFIVTKISNRKQNA